MNDSDRLSFTAMKLHCNTYVFWGLLIHFRTVAVKVKQICYLANYIISICIKA